MLFKMQTTTNKRALKDIAKHYSSYEHHIDPPYDLIGNLPNKISNKEIKVKRKTNYEKVPF